MVIIKHKPKTVGVQGLLPRFTMLRRESQEQCRYADPLKTEPVAACETRRGNPSFRQTLTGIARWHCSKSRKIIKIPDRIASHSFRRQTGGCPSTGGEPWRLASGESHFSYSSDSALIGRYQTLPLALGPGDGRPCQDDHKRSNSWCTPHGAFTRGNY